MATVHIGRLTAEGGFARSVAIKRLHPQFAHDPDFVAMFLEEARIAARIRHPNVVPVLDVVSTDGELFLVMEYVQGETVTRLTRVSRSRNRIVPMPIALAIASDMLMGLHAAHEAKDENGQPLDIVHRDISPHNVMVGRDGVSRVLDFGIAKASTSSSATREGEVKGKFAYMSPEQLSSMKADRRADVFAASIVLWEMLTGQRLFAGNDPAGIVGKVLHGTIDPPGKVAGGLPQAIDDLVMKGLARNRDERFLSALDMARALEAARQPIARPTEVGTWVDRIAGDSLKRRARRIAEIESTGSFSAPLPMPSGPLIHENTSSRSQSGRRPISTPSATSSQSLPAVDGSAAGGTDSAKIDVVTEEQAAPRRSRKGMVFIALVAALLGGAGFFVWRSGGVGPARAKIAKLLHRPAPQTAVAAIATPSGSASVAAASSALAANPAVAGSVMDLTGSNPSLPSYRFHGHGGGGGGGGSGHGSSGAGSGPVDPHVTTNVPTNLAGGGGDLGEAMNAVAGGGAGIGKDAIHNQAGPQNIGSRPSQGQVQVTIAAVMPNVRSCLLPDDPASRALLTFQSDGSVRSVSVTGYAAGKPQEACIKSALGRARVDPFTDATFAIPVTVRP
jgi:serine/threonine-protein kinase